MKFLITHVSPASCCLLCLSKLQIFYSRHLFTKHSQFSFLLKETNTKKNHSLPAKTNPFQQRPLLCFIHLIFIYVV